MGAHPILCVLHSVLRAHGVSFPGIPILISGYAAIAIAHFLYETIHAVHHQPYEACWRARLDRRWSGRFWRWLYGFHQAHHANHRGNLNVAGFFGIPLADLLFGTYKQPSPLLIDGARATTAAARALSSQPHWPISWLDRVAYRLAVGWRDDLERPRSRRAGIGWARSMNGMSGTLHG